MANSDLFDQMVLSFEDANDLEEWAIEYGHYEEDIVQRHIAHLRTNQQNTDVSKHFLLLQI